MKQSKSTLFIFGTLLLIILAVALVGLLNTLGSPTTSNNTDVRARAAVTSTLKITGVVSEVNESKGTFVVNGVRFADESRSGEAKDLGTWTVTPPGTFNLASLSPGAVVTIGIDAATFSANSHTVSAVTVTLQK